MTQVFRAPQAILLDLDGTLADTAPDFFGVVNSLREEDGRAPLPHERIREQVSNGGLALGCLTFEVTPDHPDAQQMRQRLLDRYTDLIGSASSVFAGFDEVFEHCRSRSIPWGVVTNKPRIYTEMLMPKLGLEPAVLICPDDVSRSKPSPEGLLLAAEKLAVEAAECWYVGDHLRDVEAAINAGMTAIAALFGYIESTDDPQSWPADLWIRTPDDLITLLNLSAATHTTADA